jgi:hypothetical protein
MSGMTAKCWMADIDCRRAGQMWLDAWYKFILSPSASFTGHVPRRILLSRGVVNLGTDPSPLVQDDILMEN